MGWQNLARAEIGDAEDVLELLCLLFTTVLASVHPRHDLVRENLLLKLVAIFSGVVEPKT